MKIETDTKYTLTLLSPDELGVIKFGLELILNHNAPNEATRKTATDLLSDINEFEEENA